MAKVFFRTTGQEKPINEKAGFAFDLKFQRRKLSEKRAFPTDSFTKKKFIELNKKPGNFSCTNYLLKQNYDDNFTNEVKVISFFCNRHYKFEVERTNQNRVLDRAALLAARFTARHHARFRSWGPEDCVLALKTGFGSTSPLIELS